MAFIVGQILCCTLHTISSFYPRKKDEVQALGVWCSYYVGVSVCVWCVCVCVCVCCGGGKNGLRRLGRKNELQAASGTCNQKDYR